MPENRDPSRDGCWFPDFDHQEYLLPYFDVGDTPIDPYGGTDFSTSEVRRLLTHLKSLRAFMEAKPPEWTVTESDGRKARTIKLRQDYVLSVIDKTMQMANEAIEKGGGLGFGGD